jgi:hypothetical protein
MTQIELHLYHGLRGPLNLVVVEIIFGRLFEAFLQPGVLPSL